MSKRKYSIMPMEEGRQVIEEGGVPAGAEIFVDGGTSIPEALAFIYGGENGIIDLDDYLEFYDAEQGIPAYSHADYVLFRYPSEREEAA